MELPSAQESSPRILALCRRVFHPLLVAAAAACLLGLIGWTGEITDWQHWTTVGIGWAFLFVRVGAYRAAKPVGRERKRLFYHGSLSAVVFGLATVLALRGLPSAGGWSSSWHLLIQLSIIISGLSSFVHHQGKVTARTFHPGMILLGSFAILIVIGGLLLKMPRAVAPGITCSWVDAFFTSTSAVCVTGLVVADTATYFSQTGHWIILGLIQVGGLGIMTLTFFVAIILFEGISLHDRLLLGKMMQEERLSRISRTLIFIVGMTLSFELLGALTLFTSLGSQMPFGDRVFHSIFHSVSAFCNAGFSSLPGGITADILESNKSWQICIMILIVLGGLGSLVIEDLTRWLSVGIKRWLGLSEVPVRLRVHTRLVLSMTAMLILGGACAIYLAEFSLWKGPTNGGKILTALFHSVTARTAGFNTVPMAGLSPLTAQVLMLLMLIGGSPGGTAGGLRTTNVAVAVSHIWNQLRMSQRGIVMFNRTIPPTIGARAVSMILVAAIWLILNYLTLQFLEANRGFVGKDLLFELISAFATVGLSLDLTASLSSGGRILLIINMFVGRIGLLTVLSTFLPPDRRAPSGRPEESILLT